ncbi:hypothetical protein GCM10022420_040550 [Streptomyces iranensis]|uniref:Uncharacterized protein n=1 Tax=Streptomyces iranensis TaxID=576784 RepID=A0A060ZD77_9ACTN|nr:predicted protein [Streptomyces iranensis]
MSRAGALGVAEPEVDHVERIEAEILEILVDGAAQVLGVPGRGPAALLIADRADLGHDVRRCGTWIQRFTGPGAPSGPAGTPRWSRSRPRLTRPVPVAQR